MDSGQPSSKFTEAGAGLDTVGEGVPISDGSREARVHVVLSP